MRTAKTNSLLFIKKIYYYRVALYDFVQIARTMKDQKKLLHKQATKNIDKFH